MVADKVAAVPVRAPGVVAPARVVEVPVRGMVDRGKGLEDLVAAGPMEAPLAEMAVAATAAAARAHRWAEEKSTRLRSSLRTSLAICEPG